MASLKEVKTRIASVNSTRKITSAMKMVASSKLHRAQQSIESMRPYETQLGDIMKTFAAGLEGELDSPYVRRVDEVKRVALVLVTSNSSLCGGFNGNVIKAFSRKVEACRANGVSIVKVYAIGKKERMLAEKWASTDLATMPVCSTTPPMHLLPKLQLK